MPDYNPRLVMAAVDAMPADFRALVHDFGAAIVTRMRHDGYRDADELRSVLETWRTRRQQQWLDAIPFESARHQPNGQPARLNPIVMDPADARDLHLA